MKTITSILAGILLTLASCETENKSYRYEILDKLEVVDSHYNWFTEKQVVETVQLFVVKDESGRIFKVRPSTSDYYRFNKGDKIITKLPYIPHS